MTNYLMILVISFYLYCFFGWVWESFVLPLSRKQLPYNRGFLYGPWIPIYGFGAILVIVLFDIRHVNYPFYVLVLGGGVVSCLLEYITYFIEDGGIIAKRLLMLMGEFVWKDFFVLVCLVQ